jgi:hypothetical protein
LFYWYKSTNTDAAAARTAGTQFTCFTGTKVQFLTQLEYLSARRQHQRHARAPHTGTQFTCFTSTKVQILTRGRLWQIKAEVAGLFRQAFNMCTRLSVNVCIRLSMNMGICLSHSSDEYVHMSVATYACLNRPATSGYVCRHTHTSLQSVATSTHTSSHLLILGQRPVDFKTQRIQAFRLEALGLKA